MLKNGIFLENFARTVVGHPIVSSWLNHLVQLICQSQNSIISLDDLSSYSEGTLHCVILYFSFTGSIVSILINNDSVDGMEQVL